MGCDFSRIAEIAANNRSARHGEADGDPLLEPRLDTSEHEVALAQLQDMHRNLERQLVEGEEELRINSDALRAAIEAGEDPRASPRASSLHVATEDSLAHVSGISRMLVKAQQAIGAQRRLMSATRMADFQRKFTAVLSNKGLGARENAREILRVQETATAALDTFTDHAHLLEEMDEEESLSHTPVRTTADLLSQIDTVLGRRAGPAATAPRRQAMGAPAPRAASELAPSDARGRVAQSENEAATLLQLVLGAAPSPPRGGNAGAPGAPAPVVASDAL
jgi:hypothetical protein